MKHYSLTLLLGLICTSTVQAQLGPVPVVPSNIQVPLDPSRLELERVAERQRLKAKSFLNEAALPDNGLALPLDPLAQLPANLDILGIDGSLAWQEVEISPGVRAVAREWLLLLSQSQWQQVLSLHPTFARYLVESRDYPGLDLQLNRVRVPDDLDSLKALRLLLPQELVPMLDRNHIYQPQSEPMLTDDTASSQAAHLPQCLAPIKLGMIDTGIAEQHPAFKELAQRGGLLVQRNFLPQTLASSNAHGTAVAGLLIGQGPGLSPLLPAARLYSAAAFYAQNPYQQGATLAHLLAALDWLASESVQVLNLSLTGPENGVLTSVLSRLAEKGIVMVAAAGNAGPTAPPLYPAAHQEVIAVTAVDAGGQIYRWANQGDYVDFAATGVKVITARGDGSFGMESGTSMASPVVAAITACLMADSGFLTLKALKASLGARAQDLGDPGADPVYGQGRLLRASETKL
jgi:minor extracellular protease Epr